MQIVCHYLLPSLASLTTAYLEYAAQIINWVCKEWPEMQKAASMASALVLFFPPAVLIFGR